MRRSDREVTESDQIIEILDDNKIIFVSFTDQDYPYVIPLNYGYEWVDDQLVFYFHSAVAGKKLELLKRSNKVGFALGKEGAYIFGQSDCDTGVMFESVVGCGQIHIIDDEQQASHALANLYKHQVDREAAFSKQQIERVLVYKLVVEGFSGKRRSSKG